MEQIGAKIAFIKVFKKISKNMLKTLDSFAGNFFQRLDKHNKME